MGVLVHLHDRFNPTRRNVYTLARPVTVRRLGQEGSRHFPVASLDQLGSTREECVRKLNPQLSGRCHVDDEFEMLRPLEGKL